jgi:Rhodopirellula transposase DDE domain
MAEDLHYSLQANRKSVEGRQHPDRDAQFRYLNEQIRRHHRRGEPVVSVDTKKKELIGNFPNGGRRWLAAGSPEEVRVHDFVDKELGKAIR